MKEDYFNGIESVEFNSIENGVKVLILGTIHGNEICGKIAIDNVIKKIRSNEIKLKSGSITFIPICNPVAFDNNKRYYETNLNRVIKRNDNPILYEEKIANILTNYIDNCDYMLDLHSMAENGSPFVFQDIIDEGNKNFAKAQGLRYILQGWPNIYEDCEINDFSTQTYCCKFKNKIGVTVECGSHRDESAIKIAEQSIINTLIYLNIIDGNPIGCNESTTIKMKKVFIKDRIGSINGFSQLDMIRKNDVIAKYDDGCEIISDDDYIMVLPNNNCNLNEEWFYLGKHE